MWIEPTSIGTALLPGYRRIAGNIVFQVGRTQPEVLWFDVPEPLTAAIDDTGAFWLPPLLALAFHRGEPLEIRAPVDPLLLRHALELMSVWTRWFPQCTSVKVKAEPAPASATAGYGKTGVFFTGGVDSFYSVLDHDDRSATHPSACDKVDDLIYVWGYDIPLRNRAAFERKQLALREIAARLGKNLVIVVTNLRETTLGTLNWGQVMHGPALACAALLLQKRFSSVLLSASSNHIDDTTPWGTHPLTDRLLSSSRVRLVRYGGEVSRFDKTARVAQSDVALRHLHVCWVEGSDRNCGRCEKCVRTMVAFEVLGALDKTLCFPAGVRLVNQLRSTRIREKLVFPLWEELKAPALAHGRADLASEIEQCLERSRRHGVAAGPLRFFRRVERDIRNLRKAVFRHE